MKSYSYLLATLILSITYLQIGFSQCGSGGAPTTSTTPVNRTSTTANLNSGWTSLSFQQYLDNSVSLRSNAIQSYSSFEQSYAQIKGSPFLFDNFVDATIVLNNDTRIVDIKVNYDGHMEGIVVLQDDGSKMILDSRYYKEVIVDDQEHYTVFQKPNGKKSDKFYHVLYNKNGIVFYKDPYASIRKGKNNGYSNTPDKFYKKDKYFVSKGENDVVAVNLKKKDVFKHFPEIEVIAMMEIIEKKKYKMKKESDFIALFAQL